MEREREREFEVGKDEAWFSNIKRTYDEYQQESLESIKRNRSYVDKVLSDAQQHDNAKQGIANQALQNAVENANAMAKQMVQHRDIATDRIWNVDEVAQLVAKTAVSLDAIAAAIAGKVLEALAPK